MRRGLAWTALAIVASGLVGCLYGEKVTVSGPPERPVLTLEPSRRGPLSTRVIGLDHLWIIDTEADVADVPSADRFRKARGEEFD